MDGSMGKGFMVVFAISGSVALLALQLHKRLQSDFMNTIEFELGSEKGQHKKKVRFIQNGKESSSISERGTCTTNVGKPCLKRRCKGFEGAMPLNRLVLYRGIMQYKMLFPKKEYGVSRGRNVISCTYQ